MYCMEKDEMMIDDWLHAVVVVHGILAPLNLKPVILIALFVSFRHFLLSGTTQVLRHQHFSEYSSKCEGIQEQ